MSAKDSNANKKQNLTKTEWGMKVFPLDTQITASNPRWAGILTNGPSGQLGPNSTALMGTDLHPLDILSLAVLETLLSPQPPVKVENDTHQLGQGLLCNICLF